MRASACPIVVIILLHLAACHREVRQEVDTHAASTSGQATATTAHGESQEKARTVEQRREAPDREVTTKIEEEYGTPSAAPEEVVPSEPERSRGLAVARGVAPPRRGPLVRRTTTRTERVNGAIVTTRATEDDKQAASAAASATETRATTVADAKATERVTTSVGPPWWVWLAGGLAALVALGVALVATPAGAWLLALYRRVRG